MPKTLSIIVAVAENNAIGYKNDLLAYIPNDLKRFKQITKGHTVVMGRNTWLSLPKKPLPGRKNIVITNVPNDCCEGAEIVHSMEEAIEKCPDNEESFIIGGAMVYKQFYPQADKLYLTRIHKTFEADTYFPALDMNQWQVVHQERIDDDEQAGLSYTYLDLERKK